MSGIEREIPLYLSPSVEFLQPAMAFRVFRLKTSKRNCVSDSSCIFKIVEGTQNLIALANYTEFKHVQNIFICKFSAAIGLQLGEKSWGLRSIAITNPSRKKMFFVEIGSLFRNCRCFLLAKVDLASIKLVAWTYWKFFCDTEIDDGFGKRNHHETMKHTVSIKAFSVLILCL